MKATLKEIIEQVESLPWDQDLYVSEGELTFDSAAAVIEDDGISDTFEGLKYFLSIQDVQSIVENIKTQSIKPSCENILEAMKYYHANDAFIQHKG